MALLKKQTSWLRLYSYKTNKPIGTFLLVFLCLSLYSQPPSNVLKERESDEILISKFVEAKGNNIICFDASNIKQFWIDSTVAAKDKKIYIQNENASYKIQLANVLETQDCTVEVVSTNPNLSFWVVDTSSKTLAESSKEQDFIQYHVFSSTIHLEDTDRFSFYIQFNSKTKEPILIDKIILSFSQNKQSKFLGSPGFDALLGLFDKEGINASTVEEPYKKIQSIILKENNKLYLKIPEQLTKTNVFYFYHVIPSDKKNLVNPTSSFNNLDGWFNNRKLFIVPKPYSSDSEYIIIQQDLPQYEYTHLDIGQYEGNKCFWIINFDE